MPVGDGEAEAGAIAHASRNRDLHLMTQLLETAPATLSAGFRPRFTATTALAAGAMNGYGERQRHAAGGFTVGQLDGDAHRLRPLVRDKRSSHAFERRRHRWEIDDHFIREPIRFMAQVLARHERRRFAAVARTLRPEASVRVTVHQTAGTIGAARREVNGCKGMSDVR